MKYSIMAAIAAITTLAATAPFAAETTKPATATAANQPAAFAKDHVREGDTNNDGFLSKDEWRARGDKMFSEVDANGDGKLSADEFKSNNEARRAKWLAEHPRAGYKAGEKLQGAEPAAPAK